MGLIGHFNDSNILINKKSLVCLSEMGGGGGGRKGIEFWTKKMLLQKKWKQDY